MAVLILVDKGSGESSVISMKDVRRRPDDDPESDSSSDADHGSPPRPRTEVPGAAFRAVVKHQESMSKTKMNDRELNRVFGAPKVKKAKKQEDETAGITDAEKNCAALGPRPPKAPPLGFEPPRLD